MIAYQTGREEGRDYKRGVPGCDKIAFRTVGKNRSEFTYRTSARQREFLEGWMENWTEKEQAPTMNNEFVQEIVALARQIAQYVGYSDLVDGLQPLATLRAKCAHEQEELTEIYSIISEPESDVYAEAADCLYYAACCWQHGDITAYADVVKLFQSLDLDMAMAQKAALAKYRYRASGPNKKDFAVERTLIEAALA